VKYNIVCINERTKEWGVIKTVETKKEAEEFIRTHKDLCPEGFLDFVREGFYPVIL